PIAPNGLFIKQPRSANDKAKSQNHLQPSTPPNPLSTNPIPHNHPSSARFPDRSPNHQPPTTRRPSCRTSFAGYTTHSPLRLETKYYSTEVPVWVDEIPLSDTKEQWKTDFLSEEAQIVREAVGALVVCAHAPETGPPNTDSNDLSEREDVRALRDVMRGIGAVKEKIDEDRGGVGDVSGVFVLVGPRKVSSSSGSKTTSNESDLGGDLGDDLGDVVPLSVSWWEDQFYDMGLLGWEVIEWDPKEGGEETRNQYGEREGMPRIKEVLETHDWTMTSAEIEDDSDAEDDLEDKLLGVSNSRGFGNEVHELEREMFGLRMAIERGGGDGEDEDEDGADADDGELDVESMESLMMRMQTIRDMGSDLPEAERKRFAAKAIHDIMREL
ncbi:Alpha/gamma-adaptin-binding protein p34, partial [Penicillium brevicompactum]